MAKLPGTDVLALDLPNRPKPTKKRGPNTRSGCKECKRRHIKCDEAKPACRRCVIAGLTCNISFAQVPTRNRAIRPRENSDMSSAASTTSSASTEISDYRILTKPNHILSIFGNQQQWNFFSVFVFSSQQTGTVPINTLAALTPQIAHGDTVIREICVAIGAAAGAFADPRSDASTDEKLSRTSLMHYNRAVSTITEAKTTNDTLLTVAVASILFVTYDMLRGDTSSAFIHFNHGRKVADSYFDRRCKERGVTLDRLPMSTLEVALYEMVQRLTTYPWALELGFTSTRSDHKAHMYCERSDHRYRLEDLPAWFRDLPHALTWWDVVQHNLYHHDLNKVAPGDHHHQTTNKTTPWEQSFNIIQQWHNGFLPLLQCARQNKTQDLYTYMSTCILEALYLEALTNLHIKFRPDSNVFPDNRSIYLEIVRAARETQQNWSKARGIAALDNAVARPLIFVMFKCRDPSIRREIEELLLRFDPSSELAMPLLVMMNREKGKELPPKLRNVERALGWHLTACGCNSGAP
ncbi:hypothetical protein CDV36_005920 [Fusarium kuroshium]|uniref:Zn(2)-C6 fungal-type domain-containing protein n=1 Tax=Fusarium kuroshium TaxID=2010991 RepID=A0A3M2SAY7_9HYPO|nr:hypothetical protein CDV36_005920 [Fusarium kuroshium]